MTDLALLSMFILFVSCGFLSPFIWSLGYVWVDTLLPHRLSYSLLTGLPVAFIMGAGSVLSYLLMDRRNPPRLTMVHVMCFLLAIWITFTTTWAIVPVAAWIKWDVSFKTMIFTCFMPFVFRSRIQIEAFVLVFMFSAAGHLIPWGLKTAVNGGGYQLALGLMGVNSTLLAESSTVAAVTVMFMPMLAWMRTHSLLIPWMKVRTWLAAVLTVLYLIANVGTFARTGLIALALMGGAMLLKSKRKLLYIVIAVALAGIGYYFTSDRWTARVSTITEYETEGSALVRILVWKWTINFATTHPLGGGFNSYYVNVLTIGTGIDGQPINLYGRAFHNIYMAALGEHGYPGLALYAATLILSLVSMQKVIRRTKKIPDLLWAGDLARATQLGLLVLMVCGNFVDISFSFLVWNMVAINMCLHAHVARVLSIAKQAEYDATVGVAIAKSRQTLGPRPRPGSGPEAALPQLR